MLTIGKRQLTMRQVLLLLLLCYNLLLCTGCTVVAVAGATAGAAVAVTGAAVKTTGAAVGAVIPDGEDEDDKE